MTPKKMSIETLIALAATGLFLTILTSSTIISASVLSTRSISSGGAITSLNVEIYANIECTQTCSNINWGTVSPGESITQTIYIKNSSNKPITLYMNTENWIPTSANTYMDLTWDKEGAILDTDQVTPASLTLITSSDTGSLTDFNFDIIITGVEQ
ncbi:MAG: hypothetical protein NWF10_02975 [Candidatus Bathyarchaeota archaeon]|nr:hypothetical protein [Candidatus Bathyarchaeota archaeon]